MFNTLTNIRSTKGLWKVEDDLWWKRTYGGRRLLVEDDPCMLPSLLWGIFDIKANSAQLRCGSCSGRFGNN